MNAYCRLVGGTTVIAVATGLCLTDAFAAWQEPGGETATTTVILDNLGPNGGLDPAGASPASQFDTAFAFDAAAADDFVLPDSPLCQWLVTGVSWTGVYWGDAVPGSIRGFRVVIWPDEADVPAGGGGLTADLSQAIARFDLPGNAGETAAGSPKAYQYQATFPQAVQLLPRTRYWIQVQADMPVPPQWGMHATVGRQGLAPTGYFDLLEMPAWTALYGNGDLAFQLLGAPAAVTCDDGNACTEDLCVAGACAFAAISCDDGNLCTADSCDPAAGCGHVSVACDDGDACTLDTCDPAGGCAFASLDCTDDDPCTVDVCVDGVCDHRAPYDADGDGDIDITDYVLLGTCMKDGSSAVAAECSCRDLNQDGQVDLLDYALFQRMFTGSK
jgi:hypothetical protein